jgi:TPR repeat protein
LAYLYEHGLGTSENEREAVRWHYAAASRGVPDSENTVGIYLLQGTMMSRNYAQAAQWFKKAAAQGHVAAQINLGTLYSSGLGVQLDYVLAYSWFSQAAKAGSSVGVEALDKLKTVMTAAEIHEAKERSLNVPLRRLADLPDSPDDSMEPDQIVGTLN